MKLLLLPILLISVPAFSTTIEECRSYNETLEKSVVDVDNDEVHPYRLTSSKAIETFDPARLGIDYNKKLFMKERSSCVNKPELPQPYCDYPFTAMNFMKATIAGIKTGGWDDKTKQMATKKLREYLKYNMQVGYSLLDILITETILEDARAHGILNPDKKELDKLRKDTENLRKDIGKGNPKNPDCKEVEKIYKKEESVVEKIRPRLVKIVESVL